MVHLEAMDHVIFFLVVVVSPAIDWIVYPRLLRATADQADKRREQFYFTTIVTAWAITAAIIGLWFRTDRSLATLGLGLGSPVRLAISLAVVFGLAALLRKQNRMLLARPERLRAVRGKFGSSAAIIPRTESQRQIFLVVSLTAGICEELMFRGFVVWYLAFWAGPVVAFVGSVLLFGMMHAYLGASHVPRTALVGLVFGLIVLGAGSLWPAMVLHAAIDLNSGSLGYHAFQQKEV